MADISKEMAVQLAREAGMPEIENLDFRGSYEAMTEPEQEDFDRVIVLAESIFKLGRNVGLEEAKQICIEKAERVNSRWIPLDCAAAIESLKDNTP